jgi:hypothetical protein
VADDFLRAVGFALLAWSWCRVARTASQGEQDVFRVEQRQACDFALRFVLPDAEPHWHRLGAGSVALPEIG